MAGVSGLLGFVLGTCACAAIASAAQQDKSAGSDTVRVGVIGGGIGGSSAAYWLRQLWKGQSAARELNITFLTDDSTGRTTSVGVGGQMFEEGGSVIHPKNEYMKYFVKAAAKSSELLDGEGNGFSGLVEDDSFFFFTTNHKVEDDIRLAVRYGLSVIRIQEIVDSMLKRFDRIYTLQQNGEAYATVPEMLNAMDPTGDFWNMTQQSGADYMRSRDISELAVQELVATATRVNYNQDPDNITAFPTLVALAGSQDGLFAVKGGNTLVARGLRAESSAEPPTGVHVESIERIPASAKEHTVTYKVTSTNGAVDVFESLVVAAPLQLANITFINFLNTSLVPPCCPQYQTVFATFVKGSPRGSYVNLPANMSGSNYPDLVVTRPGTGMKFLCIGRESTVTGEPVSGAPVWKIFSHERVTNDTLKEAFESVEEVWHGETAYVSKDWLAYPRFGAGPETFLPFQLDNTVVYTSTIEWVASAMEMSAISGRNAALLLYKALTA